MAPSLLAASFALWSKFINETWLSSVGVGEHEAQPCIHLYVTKANVPEIKQLAGQWQGFKVCVHKTKPVMPMKAKQ